MRYALSCHYVSCLPVALLSFLSAFTSVSIDAEEMTVEALYNATYESVDPEIGRIQLRACFANDYKTGRKIHGTYHIGYADFDADGRQDAATIISYKKDRKSLEHFELVIFRDDDGAPEQLAALDIGRGIMVIDLQIRNGSVLLELMTTKVCDENSCAYTKRELRSYEVDGHELSLTLSKSFPIDTPGIDVGMLEPKASRD